MTAGAAIASADGYDMDPTETFSLTFGDILRAAGLDPADVLAIRHAYRPDGIPSAAEANSAALLAYTREQTLAPGKIPSQPPPYWITFLPEARRRCRLVVVYENAGEVVGERTQVRRYFDLRPIPLFASLEQRLVIRWSPDMINWAKSGLQAASFPVVEISDPHELPFPGYDRVLLSYAELQALITERVYSPWRVALESVQGIYLITDTQSGRHYVGKADGSERILGRWRTYAQDGHGGNLALRDLKDADLRRPEQYQFSLLRVFGPHVPQSEVDAAEAHFKAALRSATFGLNRN